MKAIHSIVSINSCRIPPRLRLVATRLGSLILLFQRMPIVQFLFPQASVIGGASVANSVSLAVTTVVGLGVFDSVAGQSMISERAPLVVLGKNKAGTSPTSTTAINVPATVSAPLTFSFNWDPADKYSPVESWRCTTNNVAGTLPAGLGPAYNADSTGTVGVGTLITISGTPTVAPGIYPVKINVYISPGYADNTAAQIFNICVLGFSTQPAANTPISSGDTATLTCIAEGNPNAIAATPTTGPVAQPGGTLTYQWYRGLSGDISTKVGTINSTTPGFTTPPLTTTTNYWVQIKSVLGTSTVYANSNTAAVNVTAANPYDDWAKDLLLEQRGPGMIPQGDGVTNLEKFAFNLLPLVPDVRHLTVGGNALTESAGLPAGAKVGGALRIEFLRRKASTSPGITYTPQFSSSLGGWVNFSGAESVSPADDPAWERVTVDDATVGTQRFGRVKVEQTP